MSNLLTLIKIVLMKTGIYNDWVNKVQQKTSDWFEFTSMEVLFPSYCFPLPYKKQYIILKQLNDETLLKNKNNFQSEMIEKRIQDKNL